MIDSVAVISDVHGVLPVLEAVLAVPEVRQADRIVVCGDHAAGPQPTAVLDLLASVDNAVLVRGNADRELVALARGEAITEYEVDAWAAKLLSPDHVRLLADLPHPVTLEVRDTQLPLTSGGIAIGVDAGRINVFGPAVRPVSK